MKRDAKNQYKKAEWKDFIIKIFLLCFIGANIRNPVYICPFVS